MSKRKDRRGKQPSKPSIAPYLAKAERLFVAEKWQEVDDLLTPLTGRYPNSRNLWAMLADARQHLGDRHGIWEASEALLRIEPEEADNWFNAVNVAIMNGLPFTALHYADEYLRQFPDNAWVKTIREDKEVLEKTVAELLRSDEATAGATDLDYMELEQATIAVEMGNLELAEAISLRTAARSPHLAAPQNNLALVNSIRGDFEKAQVFTESVLSSQPENVHALANLVEIRLRQGQRAEAEQVAERLGRLTLSGSALLKQVQALTYVCKDREIVEHFERATASKPKDAEDAPPPMAYHLAAVAYAHLGNIKQAKQIWQQALKLDPNLTLARQNLDNLALPDAQRSKAFPFDLANWIPERWISELLKAAERGKFRKAALKAELGKFFQANPGVEILLPILLERGNDRGREFALRIAEAAQMPLLKDFALSDNGTDQERMQAAQQATELGMFAPGEMIPIVMQGKRQEVLLMNYEITSEPDRTKRPRAIQNLIETANGKLKSSAFQEAEALARQGIADAPQETTFWNYLAVSLEAQGRNEEFETVMRETAARFPDYFVARIGMARLAVRHGNTDEARTWLQPMAAMKKFHVSEFAALCTAYAEMLIADKQYDGARQWLEMWEHVEPDHPAIGMFRRKLLFKR